MGKHCVERKWTVYCKSIEIKLSAIVENHNEYVKMQQKLWKVEFESNELAVEIITSDINCKLGYEKWGWNLWGQR